MRAKLAHAIKPHQTKTEVRSKNQIKTFNLQKVKHKVDKAIDYVSAKAQQRQRERAVARAEKQAMKQYKKERKVLARDGVIIY